MEIQDSISEMDQLLGAIEYSLEQLCKTMHRRTEQIHDKERDDMCKRIDWKPRL